MSNCSALGRHKPHTNHAASPRGAAQTPAVPDTSGQTYLSSTARSGGSAGNPGVCRTGSRCRGAGEAPLVINLHPRTVLARSCMERPGGFEDQSRLQAVIIHLPSPTPDYADERNGRTHQSAGEGGGCAGPTPVSPGPGTPCHPGDPSPPSGASTQQRLISVPGEGQGRVYKGACCGSGLLQP